MSIDYYKENKIAIFTINRPQVLNALDLQTLSELSEKITDFCNDPKLQVGIITGAGERSFCTGMDLKSTIGVPVDSLFGEGTFVRGLYVQKPLIAAVNGYAFGGGLEIALSCDIRIAAENALFGLTEVTIGLIPGWGGTQRLPRLLPPGKAMEMVLMGKRINAEEAQRYHLVSEVVPPADLRNTALKRAVQIAESDPLAVQSVKKALSRGRDMTLDKGLKLESELLTRIYTFRNRG